jgi:outer membrane lipoprotein-sorting protein
VRGFLPVALALGVANAPGGASARGGEEPPPEAIRLESAVRSVRCISADFVQIRDVALTGESLTAGGTLALLPPSGFRLAYRSPRTEEIVITGDKLWVVMPEENQAQVYPFDEQAPGSEVFLLFGGGGRTLFEVFDVVQEPWGTEPRTLRLLPKSPEPGYPLEEIRVVVGKDGFPARLLFREVTGDHVSFRFSNIRRNPENIDDLVGLQLPVGIEVIETVASESTEGLPIDREREP